MGNICPANKGVDGSNTAYKSSGTSNREQVYKLSIQKGGLENRDAANSGGNSNYPPIIGAISSASSSAAAANHIINGNIFLA